MLPENIRQHLEFVGAVGPGAGANAIEHGVAGRHQWCAQKAASGFGRQGLFGAQVRI